MTETKISIHAGRAAKWLAFAAGLLIVLSSAFVAADYLTGQRSVMLRKAMKLFYVDLELNAPAFFSMFLLLLAACLLAAIAYSKRGSERSESAPWIVLCAGFIFMAFDEIIAAHERLIEPIRALIGEGNLGVLYFAWIVPAFFILLGLSMYFYRFLLGLPVAIRWEFLAAACLFIGGAVGMEMLEGQHVELYGKQNPAYMFLTTIEEALEMAGVIVFIRGLLTHISDTMFGVRFTFESSPVRSAETKPAFAVSRS